MSGRVLTKAGAVLGLGLLLSVPGLCLGKPPGRTPVATTPHFAFHSDFDTNLNDALISAGLAKKKIQPALFRSGPETACFEKLPSSHRHGWEGAVAYYAEIVSPKDAFAREQYLVRAQLAGFDGELKKDEDQQYVAIAAGFRAAAAPAYRACRWAAQDAANRAWIEDLKTRLGPTEQRIAGRLEQLYANAWDTLPIDVDVVQTVSWSGANSVSFDPKGGHLLISVENPSVAAVEVVFHEASHLLMLRAAPLRKALDGAAKAANWRLPGDLWHVVLFYTTGEAIRAILEEGGKPAYEPMLHGIFARGDWVGYRSALESEWRPYVEGKKTLDEAAAGLIESLRKARPQ
ncbi:MAG: hypothetical protein JNK60_22240 [Acidobacteria bacterium]|nr:hypothetical protein [Acidobacteriota bacterium]